MKQTFNKRRSSCRKIHIEREKLLKILNFFCRCGVVIGFVCFIGIWSGMEFGPLLIGRRLLWSLVDMFFIGISAYGDYITGRNQDDLF